ncbi:Uncharacterized protein TCM_031726 [Theobroma cacao]|uniref:Uncharacterized protein n=1 Tax=Theobroma cacao TaxID=3641 RepID=A0A061FFH9_THECC|nr:Uncharacterized protein TCM_031726 [Theobroma cacao]
MTDQIKCLQEEIGRLSPENRHLKEETGRLTAENRHLKRRNSSCYVQNECLQEEIGRLSTENRRLKEETGRLTTQNRHLEEHIRQLQSKGKLPAEAVLLRQDSHISQTTSEYKRENAQIIPRINFTTQHYMTIEAKNSEMRAQLMELSQRLQSLNEIIRFSSDAFDGEDTSLAFMEPAESDSFLNPWNLSILNQPIVDSADIMFQYLQY